MAKSDKITVTSRVHEVLKLTLAGAEFADVRQYASDHGWNVSERQIRRYIEMAYKRFAKATQRDRKQLLGRHLMQRRALYARAVKTGDIRTALQVLRDEAQLQGLYPSAKEVDARSERGNRLPISGAPPLSRHERAMRLLAAEASQDWAQVRLIEHASPNRHYVFPDTVMLIQMLHVMTLIYVTEQLDFAAQFVDSLFCATIDDDEDGTWELVANVTAYRFMIGQEAWAKFTSDIGVDSNHLVTSNYRGAYLESCEGKILSLAPSPEQLCQLMAKHSDQPADNLLKAHHLAQHWHNMYAEVNHP